jgi:glucosylglycerate phosphorylase
MQSILREIYGESKGAEAYLRITSLLEAFAKQKKIGKGVRFSQSDVVLITYGDTLLQDGELPLRTLGRFLQTYLKGVFSGLHILPFYPYSSDDGFSITDFFAVRADLGSWRDIGDLGKRFKLMVDLVANHVSAESLWFRKYLADERGFENLAIEVDPETDLSSVTRPRSQPLLTPFQKQTGRQVHVWTTFSTDQIDLNFNNLDVLENMVRALLFYISQGATIIRLDAIAYLWKEIGTPCIHLPQTHGVVRLFRSILDRVAPQVTLITETNVPHAENVAYFGNGHDEAQMVYNFTLGPLLLHAFSTGNSRALSDWVRKLSLPSAATTFFNFTASHDGIGLRPLEGIISSSEINGLIARLRSNGAHVSLRRQADGSDAPYEINITYFDALKDPAIPEDPLNIRRFLASQAVAMVLPGVPAVYIHSLLGSRNWSEGVASTGRARSINRERLSADRVAAELANPNSERARVFGTFRDMVCVRMRQPAFDPHATARVLQFDDRVFALQRVGQDQTLITLTNLSADHLAVPLGEEYAASELRDCLSGRMISGDAVTLSPYEVLWLDPNTV